MNNQPTYVHPSNSFEDSQPANIATTNLNENINLTVSGSNINNVNQVQSNNSISMQMNGNLNTNANNTVVEKSNNAANNSSNHDKKLKQFDEISKHDIDTGSISYFYDKDGEIGTVVHADDKRPCSSFNHISGMTNDRSWIVGDILFAHCIENVVVNEEKSDWRDDFHAYYLHLDFDTVDPSGHPFVNDINEAIQIQNQHVKRKAKRISLLTAESCSVKNLNAVPRNSYMIPFPPHLTYNGGPILVKAKSHGILSIIRIIISTVSKLSMPIKANMAGLKHNPSNQGTCQLLLPLNSNKKSATFEEVAQALSNDIENIEIDNDNTKPKDSTFKVNIALKLIGAINKVKKIHLINNFPLLPSHVYLLQDKNWESLDFETCKKEYESLSKRKKSSIMEESDESTDNWQDYADTYDVFCDRHHTTDNTFKLPRSDFHSAL